MSDFGTDEWLMERVLPFVEALRLDPDANDDSLLSHFRGMVADVMDYTAGAYLLNSVLGKMSDEARPDVERIARAISEQAAHIREGTRAPAR